MHPDLPHEQAYFDRALALRDRQQADLARAPSLAANPRAAVELRKRVSRLGLADPDEAIAFGRIEAHDDRWYIGKGAIWDDDNALVVVNWQAPIAAPFYTATPEDPEGLDARRLFRCSGNQIREIEDLMFREVAEAIADGRPPGPVLTDSLLDSLGAARAGELGDIVATIQAAQYEVISRPLDELLVVQGGPGTGKTVVGLHRVSWLLFNRRDRLDARDVLVVGPNPAFVGYISSVLPTLGDEAVVQLPMQSLGPRVRIGRVDPPELRRLKGDRRLLRLILRGLRNRQRVEAVPVELTVDGRTIELDGRRIATRARQLAGRPHNEGYRMLRAFLLADAAAALPQGPMSLPPTLRGEAARDIDNYLDRVWPSLTPQSFLVELFSSRRQLLTAGAGTFSESELDMLALPTGTQVTSWQWSVDDVPLLDAADALLNGVAATYEHIVVDEAQDLSPLQLESIRRRSRAGSMTVLGDLAQGTGPWAHESWDPIVQALRHERVTTETVELDYGYRLPAEVHEVAMRLLPEAAPGMSCPQALRSSGHEIAMVPVAARRARRRGGRRGPWPGRRRHRRGDDARLHAGRRRDGARRRGRRVGVRAAAVGRPRRGAGSRGGQGPRVRFGGGRRTRGHRGRDRPRPALAVRRPHALHAPTVAGARPPAAWRARPRPRRRRAPGVGRGGGGTRARSRPRGTRPPRRRHGGDAGPVPRRRSRRRRRDRLPGRGRSPEVTDHLGVGRPRRGRRCGPRRCRRADHAGPAIADTVVVSTPSPPQTPALDAAVAALDDIDHDIARAVAGAVVDRLARAVDPSLLPLVAEEIARALAVRMAAVERRAPHMTNGSGPVATDAETAAP